MEKEILVRGDDHSQTDLADLRCLRNKQGFLHQGIKDRGEGRGSPSKHLQSQRFGTALCPIEILFLDFQNSAENSNKTTNTVPSRNSKQPIVNGITQGTIR